MDKTDNRFYREAGEPKPDAWIRMDHLRQAQQAPFLCRVEPAHRPGLDLAPIFLARPASQPKALTDDLLVQLFYAAQCDITQFRIKARALLEAK